MLKWKKYILPTLIILITGIILACSPKSLQRKFYLLDYPGNPSDAALVRTVPFPVKVQVQNLKLPRTYDRTNIVVRFSSHQIDYYRYRHWAIKPQIMISDLINEQLQGYNLFSKCEREYLDENPDYEILGNIDAIEKFSNPQFVAGHLAMTFYLRRSEDFELVARHQFDREIEFGNDDMAFFAKSLSDALREEVDRFIPAIINYFEKDLTPRMPGEANEQEDLK